MSRERIAIVSSGGGMRCSYSGGVYAALAKEFGYTNPDIVIATSGSAGCAAYYLSGQYDSIRTIWTELLSVRKFVSKSRIWRVLDVNYLIDTVFKLQLPLRTDNFYKSSTEYYIPVFDVESKINRYMSGEDGADIFEVLRAAKAIPFFFRGKVPIGGRRYIDGAVGTTFEKTVADAFMFGATRVIAIDVRSNKRRQELVRTVDTSRVIVVSNSDMPVGLVTRSKERLSRAFDLGYRDAAGNQALKELLTE